MTHMRTLLTAALLASACGPQVQLSKTPPGPLVLNGKADFPGQLIDKGSIGFGASVTDTLAVGAGHGYAFQGQRGGKVTITMLAAQPQCIGDATHLDTFLWLFGPPNASGSRGTEIKRDDDSAGTCQSRISSFTLPATGEFLIVASSYQQQSGGQYRLSLTCAAGTCAPPPPIPHSFAETRIAQADIDAGRFTAPQLFEIGRFLFLHQFQIEEGLGNGLTGTGPGGPKARPNMRLFHNGPFGGPDNPNCLGCHNVGGEGGGSALSMNMFPAGDGIHLSQAVIRNAPSQWGDGYFEQVGFEMTGDLQAQLAAGKAAAASARAAQTVSLSSKGVSFGSVVVQADGTTVDFSGLQGVDQDLVIKPFGWKGHKCAMRRFLELSFQVHMGMQFQTLIARHCANPIPNTVGTGPDCHDPDADGVVDELTEGQLTAATVYVMMQPAPVRVNPTNPAALARVQQGETLFGQVGCASCHVPRMVINNPVHLEKPDLTSGPGFAVDLATDVKAPRLSKDANGHIAVELFSDLKRHDMGPALADVKSTFGVAPSVFLTRPIWAVGSTAPYLHDGRAPTLKHAIVAHDGEAAQSRASFQALSADDQAKLVEFLQTLRAPRIDF